MPLPGNRNLNPCAQSLNLESDQVYIVHTVEEISFFSLPTGTHLAAVAGLSTPSTEGGS